MLPTTYQIPAAFILLAGGLLACFAGYRLFRLVLGIYGFILGALLASSLVPSGSATSVAIAALVGGIIGAVVLTIAYFIGVVLIGAGLGVLAANAIWLQQGWGDPHALPLLAFAVVGGALALVFQRFVIIAGTAFGGAWTALAGAAAMFGDHATRHTTGAPDVWMVYSFNPLLSRPWLTILWLVLAIAGLVAQLRGGKHHST